ncbi:MAG: hypothetical protein JXA73_22430 [Acidobacteria bacterium]|nr:hypothetical protein [Acidobacteriota bacterium]
MDIKQFFDSQLHENARLVSELAELQKTWPAVEAEYNRLDKECVELAAKLAPAQAAGSPTAFPITAALKKMRLTRDGVKSVYQHKRNQLLLAIESSTAEAIQEFHNACLDRVKDLGRFYRFEKLEISHSVFTDSKTFKIRYNGPALRRAQERIFAAIREVHEMSHGLLSDLRRRIEQYENEFSSFKLNAMEIVEVSESQAFLMAPQKTDSPAMAKLSELSARVNALERN